MKRTPRSLPALSAVVLLWLAVTAGVSYIVSRAVDDGDRRELSSLNAPRLTPNDRQTTMLVERQIQPVVSGDGVVTLHTDGKNWNLEAPVSPQSQAYQLLTTPVGVKALIVGGPAGFDCPWLGLGQGSDGSVLMRCRIPADITVVAGLQGTMVLQMTAPKTTMALPVTAVVGTAQRGQVIVVSENAEMTVRDVEIGIADTSNIEITSGLQPTEKVLGPVW